MKCKRCSSALRVTNTYSTPGGKTQRAVCPACNTEYCATWAFELHEAEYGNGAYAIKAKIVRGEIEPPRVVIKPAGTE